jgi:hypothetical protein
MRVTSDLWVSALVRRVFAEGGFAAVLRRGSPEAGAIFLLWRGRTGEAVLFGPASQASYEEGKPSERRFGEMLRAAEEDALSARLEKEIRFDPDLWIVEIEAGQPPEAYFPVTMP